MKRFSVLLALALLLLWAVPLPAQTVINPRFLDFVVSPDHSEAKIDGTPVVTRYELVAIAMTMQGALVWTQDLGKPQPNTALLVTVSLPAVLPITPEALYTAKVTTIGPDGSTPSAISNPFGVAGTRLPAAASAVKFRP